jgi:hypothetical protein
MHCPYPEVCGELEGRMQVNLFKIPEERTRLRKERCKLRNYLGKQIALRLDIAFSLHDQ